jgi:hypothetical protein
MKKAIITALVLGLVAGSLAAPASAQKKKKKVKKVERVVEHVYEAPAIGSGTGACLRPTNSCGDIGVAMTERYVKVEVVDSSGTKVRFSVQQDGKSLGAYCGTTGDEPIEVAPGGQLTVFPWTAGTCPGVATQGTITATLSNLP